MKVDSEQFRVQPGERFDLLRRATTVAPMCRSERHYVMSGMNPQGCEVFSFNHPSPQELQQDFLWRTTRELTELGRIGIELDRYRSIVNLSNICTSTGRASSSSFCTVQGGAAQAFTCWLTASAWAAPAAAIRPGTWCRQMTKTVPG